MSWRHFRRGKDRPGAFVDVAMLDAQLAIEEPSVAITTATDVPPGRTGARHPTITSFATYRAAEGFMVIAAGNDAMFVRLCYVLRGRSDLSSPRTCAGW
jgi:CoA:oxalate CoA-transferase